MFDRLPATKSPIDQDIASVFMEMRSCPPPVKDRESVLLRCAVSRHTPRRMADRCTCFGKRIWSDHLALPSSPPTLLFFPPILVAPSISIKLAIEGRAPTILSFSSGESRIDDNDSRSSSFSSRIRSSFLQRRMKKTAIRSNGVRACRSKEIRFYNEFRTYGIR